MGTCRFIGLGAAGAVASPTGASACPRADVPAAVQRQQKWLHGLDIDPLALPTDADDATGSPWVDNVEACVAAAAPDAAPEVWRPSFGMADSEEWRRWRQRFG